MEQTMRLARTGWRPEETELLWREIHTAAESGAPLRSVFEQMGQQLGRKPNSVRNYYYMQLRDQGGENLQRAAPFETFNEEEVHGLLRSVLAARGKGQSVRACVMELSGGDRALMLRFQNKYRAVLRKRPDLIERVCNELQQEGVPYMNPLNEGAADQAPLRARIEEKAYALRDPDITKMLSGMDALLTRALAADDVTTHDRLRVQRDLLMMQLEDLQRATQDMLLLCKEFVGNRAEERMAYLPDFCQRLTHHIAQVENAAN